MKKAYSFRLSEGAVLAIRVAGKAWGCSGGGVIERWAVGPQEPVAAYGEPGVSGDLAGVVKGKRDAFEELKAKFGGAHGKADIWPGSLTEVTHTEPVFPFRCQYGDDVWVVSQTKVGYGYQIEGGVVGGVVPEPMICELWEKRIKLRPVEK